MSNFYNNGQRMPNIFERARAYDNWNEGNFKPQEDGYGSISDKYNDYKKVYNQLTDEEKSLSYRQKEYNFLVALVLGAFSCGKVAQSLENAKFLKLIKKWKNFRF